jgi:hypothetical protein
MSKTKSKKKDFAKRPPNGWMDDALELFGQLKGRIRKMVIIQRIKRNEAG